MQSPFQFIVKPCNNKRYENTKKIGDIDFVVSSSEEDHKASNRYAEVISTPIDYKGEIEKGDILLVHHNVFKYYNDIKGRRKSGKSFFKDNLFFLDNDQYFMYKKNGEWNAHDRYCFISPHPVIDTYIYKPLTEEPLMGIMEYPSVYLKSKGIKKGDSVLFSAHNKYEFIVDGKKMYRMFDHQISATL